MARTMYALYGVTPLLPTFSRNGFWWSRLETFFGCAFGASPNATEGLGQFFWPASSAQWGAHFSFLDISTYVGSWRGHMCSINRELGGPDRPQDAHDKTPKSGA